MRFYKYIGQDRFQRMCKGTIRAASEEDARAQLAEQGKRIDWLEEDRDANSRVRTETIRNLSYGGRRTNSWNEILSYAMPAGAAVVAIIGLVIAARFIKPPTPDHTPQQIIEQFAQLDSSGEFRKQYDLLSRDRQIFFKSADKYERQKKRWRRASEGGVVPFGKITAIEEKSTGLRSAHFIVSVFRPTGLKQVEFFLDLTQKGWRIDHFRDPHITGLYLDTLAGVPDEEMKRKYIFDLKGITGYSDLQIEEFLKGRRP